MLIRILAVDDEPDVLRLVEIKLKKAGFEVLTARDGEEGLSKAIAERPDVVLLDVMMPGLSGDAVLGLARRHAPERTRFVLFSSNDEAALRKTAAECRADGYVTKSTPASDLAAYLMKLTGRSPR